MYKVKGQRSMSQPHRFPKCKSIAAIEKKVNKEGSWMLSVKLILEIIIRDELR